MLLFYLINKRVLEGLEGFFLYCPHGFVKIERGGLFLSVGLFERMGVGGRLAVFAVEADLVVQHFAVELGEIIIIFIWFIAGKRQAKDSQRRDGDKI